MDKKNPQQNRDLEMESILIKSGISFPALRKGNINFHLMCNL